MENLTLLRKISVIHAIKCNRAISFHEAENSFNTLNEFKKRVIETVNNEIETIAEEIDNWAKSHPIAPDSEINNLMKK